MSNWGVYKMKIPIFPGRFQPFHNGHLWVLRKIINEHGVAIIAIVNPDPLKTPYTDYETFHPIYNPFNFWERFVQIASVIKFENMVDKTEIVPLIHPRINIENDKSFLPKDRVWYIPNIDEHEFQKISDFQKLGEEVIPLEIPSRLLSIRATKIRNCINMDAQCFDCYPKVIYDLLWERNMRFNVKTIYFKHREKACGVSEMRCNKLKKTGESQKSNTENKWLRAIGESVLQMAGPIGVPLKFLLSLYEDNKSEKRELQFKQLLQSTNAIIDSETLREIFEIKQGLEKNHKLLLDILQYTLNYTKGSEINFSDQFKNVFRKTIAEEQIIKNQNHILDFRILSQKNIISELIKIFGQDVELLKVIARENGFPIDKINWQKTPRVVISEFVEKCQNQDVYILANVFISIVEEYSGSQILNEFANLINEVKNFDAISIFHLRPDKT